MKAEPLITPVTEPAFLARVVASIVFFTLVRFTQVNKSRRFPWIRRLRTKRTKCASRDSRCPVRGTRVYHLPTNTSQVGRNRRCTLAFRSRTRHRREFELDHRAFFPMYRNYYDHRSTGNVGTVVFPVRWARTRVRRRRGSAWDGTNTHAPERR